jgi:hypothetical protein
MNAAANPLNRTMKDSKQSSLSAVRFLTLIVKSTQRTVQDPRANRRSMMMQFQKMPRCTPRETVQSENTYGKQTFDDVMRTVKGRR